MKILIIFLLSLIVSFCKAQNYTMPIQTARDLLELAYSVAMKDSIIAVQDSAIKSYEGRNMALTLEMQTRDRLANELIANFEKRLADTQQLLQEKELENQQLTKENKKLKRGRVLRNIVLPAALVGGFLLGVIAVD